MSRVKDLHGKIGSVVNHLNEKIALVLQKQEKEFLAAYRAHMLSVQKELQQLRAKANEAELAMKKNEKIRSLEDERNWYRKEALRLDKFATAMKKDLKYMKEKLESIGACTLDTTVTTTVCPSPRVCMPHRGRPQVAGAPAQEQQEVEQAAARGARDSHDAGRGRRRRRRIRRVGRRGRCWCDSRQHSRPQ